jgi:glycosyltransferase involved in cell wall biosynthesis
VHDPGLRDRGRALLGADEDDFVIGCAARLSEEKDHAGLLRAFADLAAVEPRAMLACAGDGPLAESLRARTAATGLADRVRWLGTVEDMPTFYASLDVCVLNSTREGLPLSLLEAMAFGIPVVATDVGGVGELLQGSAGVLVPPSEPSRLASELASLSSDPTRAQRMGRVGEARVRAEYSVDRMADEYVALYHQLVQRRHSRMGLESAQCV